MKSQRSEATQINNLPDDILCKILSLLPDTKHIFRTSILSHKWLNLCTQLPHFHFDFNIVNYDNATAIDHAHSFLHFADKVISRSAASNFQTFALHYVNYDGTHLFRINDWIQTALSRNVVHLDVKLLFLCWVLDDRAKIGLWLLGCDKLEVLKIKLSGVSLRVGSCCRFSNLKKLYVELERVNNELTSKMFTWLPKLEELSIIIGYFVDPRSELNIVGPVLKVLVFQVTDEMQFSDLSVVVCAPMLERVLVRDDSLYLYTFRDVLLNVEAEINVGTTYKGEECGDSGRGIELIRGFSSAKSLSISRCTMKVRLLMKRSFCWCSLFISGINWSN